MPILKTFDKAFLVLGANFRCSADLFGAPSKIHVENLKTCSQEHEDKCIGPIRGEIFKRRRKRPRWNFKFY